MTKMSQTRKAGKGIVNPPADEGIPMPIKDQKESWSECTLEDGTKIRIRPVIIEIRKLNQVGADGNYSVKSTLVVDVQPPPKA